MKLRGDHALGAALAAALGSWGWRLLTRADPVPPSSILLWAGAFVAFAALVWLSWAPTVYVPPVQGALADRDIRAGRRKVGSRLPCPYPDGWFNVAFAWQVCRALMAR